jgi:carboxymethylenebutenolidase
VRSAYPLAAVSFAAAVFVLSAPAHADWQQGEFQSSGKPVTEYHCAPSSPGPHPAVILLHGAGAEGQGESSFETMCTELADHGYYGEFIEYYSQTGPVVASDPHDIFVVKFPTFEDEIRDGIDALKKNPAVDPKRIALVGFSLGAYLSLAIGAEDPGAAAAIVEYYGGLLPNLEGQAGFLPPTLILHGGRDTLVAVRQAHTLDELMTRSQRPHEIHIYPSAGHAFNFFPGTDGRDAWTRTLDFLDKYLKPSESAAAQ